VERSDTHHVDDSDGFREGLNPSYDLPDGLFDLPDGQISELAVQPHLQKYFASPFGRNSFIDSAIPFPLEGRIAIVTDVGHGMRWTRMALLTRVLLADGEVVWS
jgi:hypothetical protein